MVMALVLGQHKISPKAPSQVGPNF